MRPTPAILTLTPAAVERVRALMARSGRPVLGLRVCVTSKGCSGHAYDVAYADEARPLDERVEQDGAVVFVDPGAVLYLIGATMDWKEDRLQSAFVFENPNETARCGCGESFSVRPVDGCR